MYELSDVHGKEALGLLLGLWRGTLGFSGCVFDMFPKTRSGLSVIRLHSPKMLSAEVASSTMR